MWYELDCDGLGLKLNFETEGSRKPLTAENCRMNVYSIHRIILLQFCKGTEIHVREEGYQG